MATVFNEGNIVFELRQSPIPEFSLHTSQRLWEIVGSKHLSFNVRSLDPDKYSCPYHFHRNAEEIFVILSGKVMLRTPKNYIELSQGDIVFFEMGSEGAHQLFNHTTESCQYLDIRTNAGIDICEYPDSGKVNIVQSQEIYVSKDRVDYYKGEENVADKWKQN